MNRVKTGIVRKMTFRSDKPNTMKSKYLVNGKEVSEREYYQHIQKKQKPYLGTDENGIPNIFF